MGNLETTPSTPSVSTTSAWTEPFRVSTRVHLPLVAGYAAINAVVLFNALFHDPGIGYDAHAHLAYVEALAAGHLPSPEETYEYFSPPLPYLLPAILRALGMEIREAARAGLLLDAAASLFLTWSLLALGRLMRPEDARLRVGALLLIGTIPVYYRSFAFLRGEPLVAALGLYAAYRISRAACTTDRQARTAILVGAVLGLALLSRQWAAFIAAGCLTFVGAAAARERGSRWPLARQTALGLAACLAVSGWFYAALHLKHGSAAAFNRKAAERFSLSNQPLSFYTDLALGRLFSDPVTGAFPNRLVPIFHSETWGDYWGYFTVYGKNRRSGRYVDGYTLNKILEEGPPPEWLETNKLDVGPYLGRANLVALLPAALLLGGLVLGVRDLAGAGGGPARAASRLATLVIGWSAAGYLWFLISFPVPASGATIKATYVLHVFPLLAILGGDLLSRIARRSSAACRALLVAIALCGLHNLPLFVTHFPVW